jgi:hypothetical protein
LHLEDRLDDPIRWITSLSLLLQATNIDHFDVSWCAIRFGLGEYYAQIGLQHVSLHFGLPPALVCCKAHRTIRTLKSLLHPDATLPEITCWRPRRVSILIQLVPFAVRKETMRMMRMIEYDLSLAITSKTLFGTANLSHCKRSPFRWLHSLHFPS